MNRMCFLVLLIVKIVIISCADERNVIRDYFAYRKVKRIVGFSCGDVEST